MSLKMVPTRQIPLLHDPMLSLPGRIYYVLMQSKMYIHVYTCTISVISFLNINVFVILYKDFKHRQQP